MTTRQPQRLQQQRRAPERLGSRSRHAPRTPARRAALTLAATLAFLSTAPLGATTLLHRNLGELINLAQDIVVADVMTVSDGFEDGLPYTEVELDVRESLRGAATGRLTFRQFGLLEPRTLPGGQTSALVSPPGWPHFQPGESLLLFLYKPAARSGLRTTVGLFQGKFKIDGAWIRNSLDNAGLFAGLDLPVRAGAQARRLANRGRGPIPTEELLDFIRQAVRERWFD